MTSPVLEIFNSIGENRVFIPALVKQMQSPLGIIPYVGAGMSIPFGFPGWGEFLVSLANDDTSRARVRARVTAGEFEEAAEDLLVLIGEDAFQLTLEQTFGPGRLTTQRVRGAVGRLPQISAGPVLTTNFDTVLERAFSEADQSFVDRILGARVDLISEAFHQRRRVLVKLHGDASDRSDRVVTRSDYERRYGGSEPLVAVLEFIMTRPLLFLGCSLRHDRLVRILQEQARSLRNRQAGALQVHYAVVERPDDDTAFAARRRELREMGVRPIWYPPGRHELIEELLDHLTARSPREAAVPSPATTSATHLPPAVDPQQADRRRRYLDYLQKDVTNRLQASIHHARFLDLDLEERKGSTLPWGYQAYDPGSSQQTFSSFPEAFEFFRRRLLLLGSPGCGKTTTLLHLAERLIREAHDDPGAPIPLLFNLSTFRPGKAGRQPVDGASASLARLSQHLGHGVFDDWLVGQMASLRGAGVNRETARRWVSTGNIALLLDGLDEVNELFLRDLAAALNTTYLEKRPEIPVVVACRLVEYQPLEDSDVTRLWLEGGVVLRPLDDDQVRAYLEEARATDLRNALPNDQVLMELARNPLTLSMMVLAYGGMAPADLESDLPPVERRRRLLDTYVDRMMQRHARRKAGIPFDLDPRRDQPTVYSRARINRTLGWMAVKLSERSLTAFPLDTLHSFLLRRSGLVQSVYWSSATPVSLLLGLSLALLAADLLQRTDGPGWPVLGATALVGVTAWSLIVHVLSEPSEAERIRKSYAPEDIPWLQKARRGLAVVFSWAAGALTVIVAAGAILRSLTDWLGLAAGPARLLIGDSEKLFVAQILLLTAFAGAGTIAVGFFSELKGVRWFTVVRVVGAVLAGAAVAFAARKFHLTPDWWIACLAGLLTTMQVANLATWVQDANGIGAMLVIPVMGAVMLALLGGGLAAIMAFVGPLSAVHLLIVLSALIGVALFSDDELFRSVSLTVVLAALAVAPFLHLGAVMCVIVAASLVAASLVLLPSEIVIPVRYLPGHWLDRSVVAGLQKLALSMSTIFPMRPSRFLRYTGEVMLLKRAAGKYEFMHRLLRDHFAIRRLLIRLSADGATNRLRAIEQLSLQGESSLEALVSLTHRPEVELRIAAAGGLGRIPSPQIPHALGRIVSDDPDARVRAAAIEGSRPLPEESIRELVQLGGADPDPVVRRAVVRALRTRNEQGFLTALHAALFDGDGSVTREVLALLARKDNSLLSRQLLHRSRFIAKGSKRVSLDALVSHLDPFVGDPDRGIRSICVRLLRHTRVVAAIPSLERALLDPELSIRVEAIRALKDCGGSSVVGRLLSCLQEDPSWMVRMAACKELGALRDIDPAQRGTIVSALQAALRDKNNNVCGTAASGLSGLSADRTLVEALLETMKARPYRRGEIAQTVCSLAGIDAETFFKVWTRLEPKEAAPLFRRFGSPARADQLVEDARNDRGRSGWSLELLGHLREPRVFPIVTDVLREVRRKRRRRFFWFGNEPDYHRAEAAVRSLAAIGDEWAVPELEMTAQAVRVLEYPCIKALTTFRTPAAVTALERIAIRDESKAPLYSCLEAMGAIGRPEAVPFLSSHLDGPQWSTALASLARIGDRSAVAAIEQILRDPKVDDSRRRECVRALAAGESAESLEPVIGALRDAGNTPYLRMAAAEVLEKKAVPAAVAALADVVQAQDSDTELFATCVRALGACKAQGAVDRLAACIQGRLSEPKVRWLCEQVLARIEDEAHADVLLNVLLDDPSVTRVPMPGA
jgi:HEAT repeat protein